MSPLEKQQAMFHYTEIGYNFQTVIGRCIYHPCSNGIINIESRNSQVLSFYLI